MKKRDGKKSPTETPWKGLVRRGEIITLGERCTSTASGVAADYHDLKWKIRELQQYVEQNKEINTLTTLAGVKTDFRETILVGDEKHPGYATDADLNRLIRHPELRPSQAAEELIVTRLGLRPQTVRTYAKRHRKNG